MRFSTNRSASKMWVRIHQVSCACQLKLTSYTPVFIIAILAVKIIFQSKVSWHLYFKTCLCINISSPYVLTPLSCYSTRYLVVALKARTAYCVNCLLSWNCKSPQSLVLKYIKQIKRNKRGYLRHLLKVFRRIVVSHVVAWDIQFVFRAEVFKIIVVR
jgi:hypothetical protein